MMRIAGVKWEIRQRLDQDLPFDARRFFEASELATTLPKNTVIDFNVWSYLCHVFATSGESCPQVFALAQAWRKNPGVFEDLISEESFRLAMSEAVPYNFALLQLYPDIIDAQHAEAKLMDRVFELVYYGRPNHNNTMMMILMQLITSLSHSLDYVTAEKGKTPSTTTTKEEEIRAAGVLHDITRLLDPDQPFFAEHIYEACSLAKTVPPNNTQFMVLKCLKRAFSSNNNTTQTSELVQAWKEDPDAFLPLITEDILCEVISESLSCNRELFDYPDMVKEYIVKQHVTQRIINAINTQSVGTFQYALWLLDTFPEEDKEEESDEEQSTGTDSEDIEVDPQEAARIADTQQQIHDLLDRETDFAENFLRACALANSIPPFLDTQAYLEDKFRRSDIVHVVQTQILVQAWMEKPTRFASLIEHDDFILALTNASVQNELLLKTFPLITFDQHVEACRDFLLDRLRTCDDDNIIKELVCCFLN